MGRSKIAFCEPALGQLAVALRKQNSDSSDIALNHIDGIQTELCVLDAGDDTATLTQMATLLAAHRSTASPLPQIISQIADRALRSAVEARLEQERIEPRPAIVSADALVAAHAMSQNPLFKMAFWRDQPRVHAVMIGFGPFGRAMLEEIILDGVADGLDIPLIDIITTNADKAAADLAQEMPEIQKSATIKFTEQAFDAWHSLAGLMTQIEAAAPITAIFLLPGQPRAVLSASAAISELQERVRVAIAPVFIAGPKAAVALALTTPSRQPRNLAASMTAIGGLDAIDDLLGHILQGRDIVARRMHDAYEAQYSKQTAAGTPWSDLAETYRRANRRAARHLSQKLFAIGIDSNTDPGHANMVSPMTFERLIRPLVQSSVEDDAIRRLARLEHDRWCADRRLDGWVYGEARDESRRRHPSLVAFDDPHLTADEINKDIAQLRFLFDSVVAPSDTGASVRLAIGVLEHDDQAQPGISEAAIRLRLEDEPDRDIALISPLLTAAELSVTSAFVHYLDGQLRRSRLYIPRQLADRDSLREPARDERLSELLARPSTYIVPIGPADLIPGDDWEQVTTDASPRDIVATYVAKHSDMLLNPAIQ